MLFLSQKEDGAIKVCYQYTRIPLGGKRRRLYRFFKLQACRAGAFTCYFPSKHDAKGRAS
jgi:hypothetical protein